MTKSWPLLALAILGSIGTVFCFAAFDWTSWACRLPTAEDGKVLTPGVGACFEFWFNRYQTLFGGLAAIGSAWYAGLMVRAQIKRTERQIDLSRAQIAAESLDGLRKRIKEANVLVLAYEDCIRAVNECNKWVEGPLQEMAEIVHMPEEDRVALYINNLYRVRYEISGAESRERALIKIVRDAEANLDLSIYPARSRESFAALVRYAVDYIYGGGHLFKFLNIRQAEFPSNISRDLILEAAKERPIRDKDREIYFENTIIAHRETMQFIYDHALENADRVIVDKSNQVAGSAFISPTTRP